TPTPAPRSGRSSVISRPSRRKSCHISRRSRRKPLSRPGRPGQANDLARVAARQLIDWHTHCYLPENTSTEAKATMQAHGVIGGDAWPDKHRPAVVEAADKFVVVNLPTRSGRFVPNDFIAEYVAQYPGRAVGFARVDPNDARAPEEFERSINQLGLKGLK